LHELIEHFEVAHVIVIGSDGIPIYPGNVIPSSEASHDAGYTPYSSMVLSHPRPSHSPFSNRAESTFEKQPDVMDDFDSFETRYSSASSSSHSSPTTSQPIGLPPSSFIVRPSTAESSGSDSDASNSIDDGEDVGGDDKVSNEDFTSTPLTSSGWRRRSCARDPRSRHPRTKDQPFKCPVSFLSTSEPFFWVSHRDGGVKRY
jgi:hypothetical protein